MKHTETLERLANVLLTDSIDFFDLKEAIDNFNALLLDLTQLDLEALENKQDIHFDNGMALGTTFAAMCVVDLMRTRQYIRGVYKAIQYAQAQKNTEPVRLLYAGTEPFATLILPLLTKFSPNELELVLMEINPNTLQLLKQVIEDIGIEDYIIKIICADASTYALDDAAKSADILLSETMQHGLVKEQQVPIMLNLVSQLKDDVIVLPQNIQLDLALVNSSTDILLSDDPAARFKKLATIWTFDKEFMQTHSQHPQHLQKNSADNEIVKFELCKDLTFRTAEDVSYDKLAVLTSIQIFNEEWLEVGQSGLTIPKILFDLNQIDQDQISIWYEISSHPNYNYELK